MFGTKTSPARLGRIGLAVAVAAAGSITLFQGVSSATAATYTAVPATGPAGAKFVVTLTGTGFADAAGVSQVDGTLAGSTGNVGYTGVQVLATCPTTEPTGTTNANAYRYNVVSATKLSLTTSAGLTAGSSGSTAMKVCVFDKGSSHNLLGSATYTVYAQPTITGVSPAAGPAFGGNTVSVAGTNFTAKSKVTIGGVALTNIKVTGTTSVTGTVPAHAATTSALHVVVTTEAGPNPSPGSTTDNYNYNNAVTLSPVWGGNGTVIDVKGVGFNDLDFTQAAVYFVDGKYDATDTGSTAKTHDAVATDSAGAAITGGAQCGNIQVLSDTELVCVAPDLADGAYTLTIVSNNGIGVNDSSDPNYDATYIQSVISSGSTFTFGKF